MTDHGWQALAGFVVVVLAAMNPYAAAGAAFGCCFYLAFPSASRGLQRLLYGVFSWGIGYAAGVFFYGDGPPYSQKSMLVAAIVAAFGNEVDEFDIEAAIYWFASDYHSGQWSELYSILSTSEYRPGRMEIWVADAGEMAAMAYDVLKDNFGTL